MAETRTARNATAWFGWVIFAAVMLAVIGLLNVLEGLVALLQREVAFIDGDRLVVVDLTGLGVVMLAFGGLLIATGIGLAARNTVARVTAIVIVALHMLVQVATLGAYPVWSLLMITLDVIILFALTVHWTNAPDLEHLDHVVGTQQPPGGIHRMDRDTGRDMGRDSRDMGRDRQQRGPGFPVNAPTSPSRSAPPAHAAPNMPEPQASTLQPQAPPSYQQWPQSPYRQPPMTPWSSTGPYYPSPYYPSGRRPSSPPRAAPTFDYG
jgi:hypothetical protein